MSTPGLPCVSEATEGQEQESTPAYVTHWVTLSRRALATRRNELPDDQRPFSDVIVWMADRLGLPEKPAVPDVPFPHDADENDWERERVCTDDALDMLIRDHARRQFSTPRTTEPL